MPSAQPNTSARALWLLPLAALLAIVPLILHGCSCGQDLSFHIQSWLDAATQLRHVHYPHWDISAAWNAGEPRFLFYPPLSWLLGATLTLIFPTAAASTIYIFLALLASGLTFHKLARHFASPNSALIASALYLANPYMLFCAFERSALAELLAAAWLPLLLLAVLRARPTIRGIAVPLALLWLTNAPAAVIGSYTLALVATLRVAISLISPKLCHSERSVVESKNPEDTYPPIPLNPFQPEPLSPLRLTLTTIAGALLGLALPAFYLIPAAFERRFIQVAMAIIPNMRYQDNFLFTHTPDAAHNLVNHTASTLALTLLLLTTAALIALLLRNQNPSIRQTAASENSVILSEVSRGSSRETQSKDPEESNPSHTVSPFPTATFRPSLTLTLVCLTILIAFLLTPLSTPIWHYLPELAFLQFPWRLLILLTPILALAIALLLDHFNIVHPNSARPNNLGGIPTQLAALLLPLALGLYTFHLYAQSCEPTDTPTTITYSFATHHGFAPTDEYTPTLADNDVLRSNNPTYWLIPKSKNQATDPNTPAPHTSPTASELNPSLDTDDIPIPLAQTLSTPAPHHLTLNLPQPETLILNLRAYPNWRITGTAPLSPQQRNDGLIVIALPSGPSTLDIAWHRTPDQTLGLLLSAVALICLILTYIKPSTTQLPPSAQNSAQDRVESL